MAPRTGFAHNVGAVDFMALVARNPTHASHMSKRELTTVGIVWVVILALTLVSIIFCVIVGLIICKNKAQARKRQQKFEASRPVENQAQGKYVALEDMEPGGIQEMPTNSGVKRDFELEGNVNEVPRVQQLDGFTAPPRVNSRPIELPPDAYARAAR